jgi:hypothetical protein
MGMHEDLVVGGKSLTQIGGDYKQNLGGESLSEKLSQAKPAESNKQAKEAIAEKRKVGMKNNREGAKTKKKQRRGRRRKEARGLGY